jgi:hypothetical protein
MSLSDVGRVWGVMLTMPVSLSGDVHRHYIRLPRYVTFLYDTGIVTVYRLRCF